MSDPTTTTPSTHDRAKLAAWDNAVWVWRHVGEPKGAYSPQYERVSRAWFRAVVNDDDFIKLQSPQVVAWGM